MKEKTKKEVKEEPIIPNINPFLNDSAWLMGLLVIGLLGKNTSDSKTTINIYTGDNNV